MPTVPKTAPAPISPAELQRLIADALARAAELGRRQDALADALVESRYPEVPYDSPLWDDPDRWELSPAIPPGTAIVPAELADDELDRDYPFLGFR